VLRTVLRIYHVSLAVEDAELFLALILITTCAFGFNNLERIQKMREPWRSYILYTHRSTERWVFNYICGASSIKTVNLLQGRGPIVNRPLIDFASLTQKQDDQLSMGEPFILSGESGNEKPTKASA
jgi:hypothetical protein